MCANDALELTTKMPLTVSPLICILCLIVVQRSLAWFAASTTSSSLTAGRNRPPTNIKILILPGFGNESADYFLDQAPQGSLVDSLQARGWTTVRVLPMQRSDWLQVFINGALDIEFWMNRAPPTRPAFRWYLDRVAEGIEQLTKEENSKVILLCHSAGGWLGRAALGYLSDDNDGDNGNDGIDLSKVCGIVTLGAPHLPPPAGVMDMTRGALRLTHETFPGAYFKDLFFYITVSGDAVKGIRQQRTNPLEPTSITGFAFNSYAAVCGDGETIGDGRCDRPTVLDSLDV